MRRRSLEVLGVLLLPSGPAGPDRADDVGGDGPQDLDATPEDPVDGLTAGPFRTVVVDDVEALRRLVEIALTRTGRFEVVGQAGDGAEAIDVVTETRPDLVLLDLSMPRMDGLEALPKIRQAVPEARVVILTGFEESRLGDVARRRGAVGYLEKGLSPQMLELTLLKILGTRGTR